jgi:hypothetical protein
MQIQKLELEKIMVKGEIQQRAGLNFDYIDELSDEIANGSVLPPLDVFDVAGELEVVDGFHRLEAYKRAGVDRVEVNIIKGTERDATLHAVGANAEHGLRRKNADKRRAVKTLLTDDEWGQWSDCEIARRAHVSPTFVSKVKRALGQNGFEFSPVRKCADGRIIDTSKIGDRSSDDTVTEDDGVPDVISESKASNILVNEDTVEPDPESYESSSEVGQPNDAIEHRDVIESDDFATNDEIVAETGNEDIISKPTENLYEMIKDYENESAIKNAESTTLQESDDQSHETEMADNTNASEVDDYQPQSEEKHEINDVQSAEDKMSELEKVIKEKDLRISELEAENAKLRARIRELEVQAEMPDDLEDFITDIETDKQFAN